MGKKRGLLICVIVLFLFFTASLFYFEVVAGSTPGEASGVVLWQNLKQIVDTNRFEITSPKEFVTCSISPDSGNGYDYCYAYVELFNNYTNLTKAEIVSALSSKWNKVTKIRNITLFVTRNSEIYNVTEYINTSEFYDETEQIYESEITKTYRNFTNFMKLSEVSPGAIWAKGEKLYVKLEFEKERWEKVSFNFSVQKDLLNLELDPDISNCGTLDVENGVYTLTASVDSSGTCFTIAANNITLDCNGYTVNYSSAGLDSNYGITSTDMNYTTIKRCNLVDTNATLPSPNRYRHGIVLYRAYFVNVTSNNISIYGNTSYGIYVIRGSNYTFTDNLIMSNQSSGIYFTYAWNSSIINNTISSPMGVGIHISVSNYTNLINNVIASNSSSGIFLYPYSYYNTIINNTVLTNGTVAFYIHTSPYNTLINNTGTIRGGYAAIYLYYANHSYLEGNFGRANTTAAIDLHYSHNSTLINNTGQSNYSAGILLYLSENNTFVDNFGVSEAYTGIYLGTRSNYNNFTNNRGISNKSYGIYVYFNSSNNFFSDNLGVSNSGAGIFLYVNSSYNTLINNTGVSNGTSGIYLWGGSNYNTLINNTGIGLKGSIGGFGIYNCTGNNLTNNVGISTSSVGIHLWGSSYTTMINNTGISNTSVGIYFRNASYNTLINSTGASNSSSAIYLYYDSFHNTLINNTGISNRTGIHMQQFANYNTLINNTGIGLTQYGGIYSYNCTGNNLTNNLGIGNSTYGIALLISTDYTVVNNIGKSNSNYGIYLNNASNNLLINNTGTSNSSGGIVVLYSSSSNTLINNTGDANGTGIHLQFFSDYNTLINNTGITHKTGYAGIYLQNCTGNNFTGNFGAGNSTPGIFFSISNNNTLIDNIGISNSSNGLYIYYSDYNNLTGNTGISNSSYALYLYRGKNNTLVGNNATGLSTGSYGIYLANQSAITMKDCSDLRGVSGDIYIHVESSTNFTIINCSYNASKEFVNGAANRIIRQWYYSAYANDTAGNPVSNANLTAYNSFGDYQFNLTTSDSGYTLSNTPIVDYVNLGGTVIYYSLYTIYAINSSDLDSTHYWNVTLQQNNIDAFTMDSSIYPDVNFTAPTPANDTLQSINSVYINVSTYDTSEHSAFIDWNRSLVGWWSFDEINSTNGTIYDNSSYNLHATLYNHASNTTVSGKRGQALEIDGIDDYAVLGTPLNSPLEWTYSVWFYPKESGSEISTLIGQTNNPAIRWGNPGGVNRTSVFLVWSESPGYKQIYSGGDLALNQWYHVVGVINLTDSSNQYAAIYINGVRTNYQTWSTGTITLPSTTHYLNIRDSAKTLNATLDEVIVFPRALTPTEINATYQAGLYKLYRNFTNLSDGTYTYKAYAIDIAGNVNATEERTITIDATLPQVNFTAPTPANDTFQSATDVYVNVSTYDVNNHSAFIDWNRSLISWWNFDSVLTNGTVYDNSSYGNHGRLINHSTNTTTTGIRGKALEFDAVNDFVIMDYNQNLNITNELTVEAWFYHVGYWSWNPVVSRDDSVRRVWNIRTTTNAEIMSFVVWNQSSSFATATKTFTNPINTWHHLAAVYNGTDVIIYIDGIPGTPANLSGNIKDTDIPLYIGEGAATNPYWNGSIDEVRIYSRALTHEEIDASYNAGAYRLYNNFTYLTDAIYTYKAYAIDIAGNVNATEERTITIDTILPQINFTAPTPANDTLQSDNSVYLNVSTYDVNNHSAFIDWNRSLVGWWAMDFYNLSGIYDNSTYNNFGIFSGGVGTGNIVTGVRGKALEFDGYYDYLQTTNESNFDFTTNFTLEAWIKPTGTDSYNAIIGKYLTGSASGWDWILQTGAIRMNARGTSNIDTGGQGGDLRDGNWHHIVAVVTNSYIQQYIDSAPYTTVTGNWTAVTNDANVAIGYRDAGATIEEFEGTMDEVKIYGRALTLEEVKASYDAGTYRLYKNFTNLPDATYTYKAYTIDIAGNVNSTGEQTVRVNSSVVINCSNLSIMGKTYFLESDIINNQVEARACINITQQNITLDCQGHLILSDRNISGIYSTMRNTTIQNCNVDIGGGNKTNISAIGIYYNYTGRNGKILNNVVNATYGILLDWYANFNSLINNTAYGGTSVIGKAIFLRYASYCNLTSNIGITPNGYTIISEYGNYNILKYNLGISGTSTGFRFGMCYHNLLINNTGISTSYAGVYLLSGANNTLINNTGISGYHGFLIHSSSNNTFINNTANNTIITTGAGFVITSYTGYPIARNNTFINNTFNAKYGYGIHLANTTGNTFYNSIVIGSSSGSQAIYTSAFAMNNTFYNCVNISGIKSDINSTSISLGNTFVNCSYNISKEFVGSNSQLIRKWYYSAYASDTGGNSVSNANVTAYNSSSDYQFNLTTTEAGYTPAAEIIDYVNDEGTRSYYSNYTIYSINSSYSSLSHSWNVTERESTMDTFTFIVPAVPSEVPEGGGGEAGCTYDWVCSEWYPEPCNQDGIQKRVCVNRGGCTGTFGMPALERNCTPEVFEPAEALFDIFVNIPLQSKWILKGDNVSFDVRLINVGNKTTIDVFFQYLVIDSNNTLIAEKRETRAIGEREEFGIELPLPENLKEGTYRVYVQIDYDKGKVATASDSFEIVKDNYILLLRRAVSFLPALSIPIIVLLLLIKLLSLSRGKRERKYKKEKIKGEKEADRRRHLKIYEKEKRKRQKTARRRERREARLKEKRQREYSKRYKKRKRKLEREIFRRKEERIKPEKPKQRKEKPKVEIVQPSISVKIIKRKRSFEERHRRKKIEELKTKLKKR